MEQWEGDGEGEEGLRGRKAGGSRKRVDGPGLSPHPSSTFPVRRVGQAAGGTQGSFSIPRAALAPLPIAQGVLLIAAHQQKPWSPADPNPGCSPQLHGRAQSTGLGSNHERGEKGWISKGNSACAPKTP